MQPRDGGSSAPRRVEYVLFSGASVPNEPWFLPRLRRQLCRFIRIRSEFTALGIRRMCPPILSLLLPTLSRLRSSTSDISWTTTNSSTTSYTS